MKTKTQLEKEIEESKKEWKIHKNARKEIEKILYSEEATLTQTNEIIKLIEEMKDVLIDRNDVMHDQTGVSMDLSELKELLTKIKGDGE